jgi:dTDP-4-dehydrorhamnose reductase
MEDIRHPRSDPERLLITGIDQMLGANLALSLADRFEVTGLFAGHPVSLPGCRSAAWEPSDTARWEALIRRRCPDWMIHCTGLSSSSWDVPEPSPNGELESRTSRHLAKICDRLGSRLTVISTDAVFEGPRLFHEEDAPATCRHAFAQAARRAEKAVESTGALVVRTHAYGWSPAGAPPGFAERVWETLIEGGPVWFDPDRHATPILASALAELLCLAYRRGLQGRYHVTGAERTSAYRFAVELATAFGLRPPDPLAGAVPLDGAAPEHLHETSLNTRRARRDLGRPMPMLRDGLDGFAQQAKDGYRTRLKRCASPPAVSAEAA